MKVFPACQRGLSCDGCSASAFPSADRHSAISPPPPSIPPSFSPSRVSLFPFARPALPLLALLAEAVVAFRGTDPADLENWIEDLKSAVHTDYPLSGCSGCQTAEGFTQSYMALRSQIMSALPNYYQGSVIVTGHSLGAAMAGLCAFDLQQQGYNLETVYTFGQPRVGDETFFNTFQSMFPLGSYYRVVHYKDIVPHLPFEIMGYHHMSTEVWYQENNIQYQVCDGSGCGDTRRQSIHPSRLCAPSTTPSFLPSCSRREDDSCSDSVFADSVSDHLDYLNYYISQMC